MDAQTPESITPPQVSAIAEGVRCGTPNQEYSLPSCTSELGSSSSQCLFANDPILSRTGPNSDVLIREIEASKVHWSELSSQWDSDEDKNEESNQEIFERLRYLPQYEYWLDCDVPISSVDLMMGEKLAEGSQAEIYELKHKCHMKPPRPYCHCNQWWPGQQSATNFERSLRTTPACSCKMHQFVLKVFKKGYSLRGLQFQWPEGIFTNKNSMSIIQGGTVLDDDRFAFLLRRCDIDLRKLINIAKDKDSPFWIQKIPTVEHRHRRPSTLEEYRTYEPANRHLSNSYQVFSDRCTQNILCHIAWEMNLLHSIDVLHRDLKASNILCRDHTALEASLQSRCRKCGLTVHRPDLSYRGHDSWCQGCSRPLDRLENNKFVSTLCENCSFDPSVEVDKEDNSDGKWRISFKLADFESSIGVVGTAFWRAPEILQQLKDRKTRVHFTPEADVYSYAMTCYEILTGRIPFEAYKTSDYDHVLLGVRPTLPDHIPPWMRHLIESCWHQDPSKRPTFNSIWQEIYSRGKLAPPYDFNFVILEKARFW